MSQEQGHDTQSEEARHLSPPQNRAVSRLSGSTAQGEGEAPAGLLGQGVANKSYKDLLLRT